MQLSRIENMYFIYLFIYLFHTSASLIHFYLLDEQLHVILCYIYVASNIWSDLYCKIYHKKDKTKFRKEKGLSITVHAVKDSFIESTDESERTFVQNRRRNPEKIWWKQLISPTPYFLLPLSKINGGMETVSIPHHCSSIFNMLIYLLCFLGTVVT